MSKPVCLVTAPVATRSGYGAHGRDICRALIKLDKYDVKIWPVRWGNTPMNALNKDDPNDKMIIDRILPNPQLPKQPDVWMQITIPNEFQSVGKYNIGITAGIETTVFPGNFIEGMNNMDLNLVSSNHSKYVALNSQFEKVDKNTKQKIGVIKLEKPVEVLFEGLDLDRYNKIQNPKSTILNNIPEEFCFLFTGHWLPGIYGEDRKNTGLLIKTFLETFNSPSSKKPALILKTNQVNYSLLDREEIIKRINLIKNQVKGSLPNIYLLHGEMTDEEMNLLNNDPKVKAFISFTLSF